jgi:phenylalanyl-tRNA synthetase beta chain
MKASFRWLQALLPGFEARPADLADRLTRAGLEVEAVDTFGAGLESLVLVSVRQVEPHPSRSGLRLVTVDRGSGREERVVCGAPNVPEPGGLVVLAPLGAHLVACGLTVAAREIGGIKSEGMLCSEEEMGLAAGGGHGEGILILPPNSAAAGTPFLTAIPAASDTILDIAVTPNRGDALCHVGLAREIAALYGLPWKRSAPLAAPRVVEGNASDHATVVVEDKERCPHYGAAVVHGVRIAPSPAWVRYRLLSLGVRPISNVVDATNLVLFEVGHPMHAFDLDRVRGRTIVVRCARAGETLRTLDGVDRQLAADDLLICDGEGPVALAGVMGGETSEISSSTKNVLLECACFEPRGIRRASRRHALHTESSHRFERGVDRGAVRDSLAHAASLIADLAGGGVVQGAIHECSEPPAPRVAELRSARLDALLGTKVPFDEATSILVRLGFGVRPKAGTMAEAVVEVPTFRQDVNREADLIEEVARVRGLDAIPTVLPAIKPQHPRDAHALERRVREAAVALGLSEAVTYGFVSPKDLAAVRAPEAAVVVANPLSEERSVMRTSLLPGLLEAVARARRHGESDLMLFTLGARFLPAAGAAALPDERPSFAAVLAGNRRTHLEKPRPFDVFDAKGLAVEIAERAASHRAEVAAMPHDVARHLHPRGAATLTLSGHVVGAFGPLHPEVLEAWRLDDVPVVAVEIDLRELSFVGRAAPRFVPIPRLPAATRDIALVVHDRVLVGDVERIIREVAGDLCESVELFDVFQGPSLPADHRSLAFHVVYRDPRAATAPGDARALTDQEVDERHAAVVSRAKAELGATLRS